LPRLISLVFFSLNVLYAEKRYRCYSAHLKYDYFNQREHMENQKVKIDHASLKKVE